MRASVVGHEGPAVLRELPRPMAESPFTAIRWITGAKLIFEHGLY